MPKAEQYKTYLEFHNSNWYAYWDTDSPPVKYRQMLQAWHIDNPDNIWEFAYDKTRESIKSGIFVSDIKSMDKTLSESDVLDLQAAAICFISGVESKYPV